MNKPERRSFNLEQMQQHAEELGGKCMADKYTNSTYKMLFKCKDGHKWRASALQIMGKKSGVGSWCPKCEPVSES